MSALHSFVSTDPAPSDAGVALASPASVSDAIDDTPWDDFVASHCDPHPEQASLWAKARTAFGWKPVRLIVRQGDRIVGGAQILERQIGRFTRIGYLARGPLLADDMDVDAFVAQLCALCRVRQLSYLAVSLPYSAHTLVRTLERHGFVRRPEALPPSVWVKATAVVDLAPDFDTVVGRMDRKRRQQLRRGWREGLKIRDGTIDDLPVFEELLAKLCARRNVVNNVPGGPAFVRQLWQAFSPGHHIHLLLTELDGEPVCAQMLLLFGQWARAWRMGWSGRYANYQPNVFTYCEAMRWAKENGYRYYDVVGVDENDAQKLLRDGAKGRALECSVTHFKVSLGGQVRLLPGEFCLFPNRGTRVLFRVFGRHLLNHKATAFGLQALYNRLYLGADQVRRI